MMGDGGAGGVWRLRKGPYRGDISALCLVSSPRPLLLAGTGPHVLLYDFHSGHLLSCVDVFEGVRVHGLVSGSVSCGYGCTDCERKICKIVVHGERRVKVYELFCPRTCGEPHLSLWRTLPRFSHWVMDARFLPTNVADLEGQSAGDAKQPQLLVIGFSNNSVCVWDLLNFAHLYRVECSERLLLYCMRLWGDSLDTLLVAVGTIFNEVLVWKLGHQAATVELLSQAEKETQEHELQDRTRPKSNQPSIEVVDPLQRLLGHEGSIHRLTWSADGRTLVSVSDDRSARVWNCEDDENPTGEPWMAAARVGPVLFGHGARIWDCHVTDKLFITAGEDCTCRIWTADGKCLTTLRGHQGRGIWRCIYDQELNVVVTAGTDSSIKIQSLDKWTRRAETVSPRKSLQSTVGACQAKRKVYEIRPVWLGDDRKEGSHYLDSKSEYVRCVKLCGHSSIYVGTNQGYLYHVKISESEDQTWTELLSGRGAPLICMDVHVERNLERPQSVSGVSREFVVVGDGKGNATAFCRSFDNQTQPCWSYTWSAEKERQLLEVFWCKDQPERYIFTADPKGTLRMWELTSSGVSSAKSELTDSWPGDGNESQRREPGVLIAVGRCAHGRVVCIDICWAQKLVVCGDNRGNLTIFTVKNLLFHEFGLRKQACSDLPVQLETLAVLKGAHGISSVTEVCFIAVPRSGHIEIRTTGKDGCICRFRFKNDHQSTEAISTLNCLGIKKTGAVSMLEGLKRISHSSSSPTSEREIVAGFTGSDFLLWDVTRNSELLRVRCGGWRRPFSFLVGEQPDVQHAFVYVKDQIIQVNRHWASLTHAGATTSKSEGSVRSLHGCFHGKEVNSVALFASPVITGSEGAGTPTIVTATGAEDGFVILSTYRDGVPQMLDSSLVLGDHVGGSAVRSLALVEEVYSCSSFSSSETTAGKLMLVREDEVVGSSYLFSAGAKGILTCWRLDWTEESSELQNECVSNEVSRLPGALLKLSAHWLSTRMPPSNSLQNGSKEDLEPSSVRDGENPKKMIEMRDTTNDGRATSDLDENKYRLLAVTAFAVDCGKTANVAFFVVTASSNATLTISAFHSGTKVWSEVSVLDYPDAPVLTIQHIVARCPSSLEGCTSEYLVLTGATNGQLALWDISSVVLQYCASGCPDVKSTSPGILRPLTGRGSQGGRRRRPKEEVKQDTANLASCKEDQEPVSDLNGHVAAAREGALDITRLSLYSSNEEGNLEAAIVQKPQILSCLQEVEAVHQSGINCMSVARVAWAEEDVRSTGVLYVVVTGGDDEVIHLAKLRLLCQRKNEREGSSFDRGSWRSELLSCGRIPGAHSSAVKGIWTDGSWVFSVGLDQRLRCWKVTPNVCKEAGQESKAVAPLVECMASVVDVPEPVDLHVRVVSRGKYQIAVVGRGLQVISFESSDVSGL